MNPQLSNVLEKLASSVHDLLQLEYLAYAEPGERNVVSELFYLLRARFPEHIVSNEYDRREQEVKRLGKSRIIPDLLVHHVGNQAENLLVVEIKLAGNSNYESDVRKLQGMTDPAGSYRYLVGVHLVLNVRHRRLNRGHVYVEGSMEPDITNWFESQFA